MAKVATETLEVATQPVTLGVLVVDVAEEAPLGETEVVLVVDVAVQAGETVEEAAAVGFNNTKSSGKDSAYKRYDPKNKTQTRWSAE